MALTEITEGPQQSFYGKINRVVLAFPSNQLVVIRECKEGRLTLLRAVYKSLRIATLVDIILVSQCDVFCARLFIREGPISGDTVLHRGDSQGKSIVVTNAIKKRRRGGS